MTTRLLGLILLLTCSGCAGLKPTIPGSGNLRSEFRQVPVFQRIDLAGVGEVHVAVGQSPSVQVATDDNLLPTVETTVENGTLKIRNRKSIRPRSGLTIHVTTPQLTAVKVSGIGEVHAQKLAGDSIQMLVSGAGSISASGYVQNLDAKVSGAGDVDLSKLVAHSADVAISGAGDATVFALESLDAKVSGAGDLTCYGNPAQVKQQVSGAGDIHLKTDSPTSISLGDNQAGQHRTQVR